MKIKPTVKRVLIHLAIIFAVILAAEVFVCNYKHFLILPSEEQTYSADDMIKYGLQYVEKDNSFTATLDNPTLEIKDIGSHIVTLYAGIDWEDEKNATTNIKVYYTDETRPTYVSYGKELQIVKGFENSKYLQQDFNGISDKLKLQLKVGKGTTLYIDEIAINKTVPFHFSFARVGAMLIIAVGIYAFVMLFRHRDSVDKNESFCGYARAVATLMFALLVILIYGDFFGGFINAPAQNHGTQISEELVDSFLSGKVNLLEQPSDKLLALEDPYIPANRTGVSYLWDHVYYEGKYYSYYGITPVIMLFIPFHLLTGLYLYDGYAVLLFSLISIIFISLAYYNFVERFCPKTPLYMKIFGQIILLMSCGILSNIARPAFYEVATSCAFMCLSVALYHLSRSGILHAEDKISLYHTTFMSFWTALAVLARATFALYAVCAVIIFVIAFFERKKDMRGAVAAKYIACAALPLVTFGLIQCAYNYARFGNIFEFGIQYSLTINDFTNTDFHFSFAFASLFNFMFAVPTVNDTAYFIHPQTLAFGASGYYFFETFYAFGLFNRVPIMYSMFAMPFMKTGMKTKDKAVFTLKYILPCIVVPVILALVTWQSGYAMRYYSDLAPTMLLFSLILFFKMYEKGPDQPFRSRTYAVIFGVTAFLAFVGAMSLVNVYVPNFGRHVLGYIDYGYTHKYYRIARELSFWY